MHFFKGMVIGVTLCLPSDLFMVFFIVERNEGVVVHRIR